MKSLYTNIPNDEGKKAVREAYDNHLNKTVATKVIITFFSLILTLNNFVFNSVNYLQIMGCTMGKICAPAYANTFMAQFENQYMYPYTKNKPILYLRYIVDIFMIWTGTKQELLIFSENSNTKHERIKFEHNISHSKISFLDALIYKDKKITLQTTLYQKPTDQQSYLQANSDHPKSLKRSIPYSQVLRIKTICSTLTEYKKHCAIPKPNFIERGYEENILKDKIDKVENIDRKDLLSKKEKKY